MKLSSTHKSIAKLLALLSCAVALKWHYATASADQLRWILAPTTTLVTALTGVSFEFEAQAGYLSREQFFLIAPSCAGVNFLLTAFLLLTLSRLWHNQLTWRFLPLAAISAYLVTLVANTVRIVVALWLRQMPMDDWQPAELHRAEGILVYFGFLLLLFVGSESLHREGRTGRWRQVWFPLALYYATTLGIPLLHRAGTLEATFTAHALAVLLLPLLLVLPLLVFGWLPVQDAGSKKERQRATE